MFFCSDLTLHNFSSFWNGLHPTALGVAPGTAFGFRNVGAEEKYMFPLELGLSVSAVVVTVSGL